MASYVFAFGLFLFLYLVWIILHCCLFFSGFVLLLHLYSTCHAMPDAFVSTLSISEHWMYLFSHHLPKCLSIHVRSGLEVGAGDISKLGTNTEVLVFAIAGKSCECSRCGETGWQVLQGQSALLDSRECPGCPLAHTAATGVASLVYQAWFISYLWPRLS